MRFIRGLWHFLVGVKDALVLLFLVLFFGGLWAALSSHGGRSAGGGGVPSGSALLIDLNGRLVEQETARTLGLGGSGPQETELRDVLRAVDHARTDSRIKAIVLDLDTFNGGGQANIQAVGQAIDRFKAAGKPVYAFATGYVDDGYQLAAHATEAWLDPLGGVLLTGPGGANLYFKSALDRLAVDVEVFRVGTYKSAVEPFIRADASPEARAAEQALVDSLWRGYAAEVRQARRADVNAYLTALPATLKSDGGDEAKAALDAHLIDRIGSETQFGRRVAQLVGDGDNPERAPYRAVKLASYLKAIEPVHAGGDAVGVVYIAGNIVDGEAPTGQAGGDTIAKAVRKALANDDIKALVLRIDSPGGSVLASEKIRQALMEAKDKGLPIVASFGELAASGGYWVSTPASYVYAEPSTITGSIGVFAIIPTFAKTLDKYGIHADGVKSTPFSGEPDVLRGLTPATRVVLQTSVEDIYRRFTGLVAGARHLTPARVDQIGQGRVWSGADALGLHLIDAYGGLDEAVADARRRAHIAADARTVDVEAEPTWLSRLLKGLGRHDDAESQARDPFAKLTQASRGRALAGLGTARTMLAGGSTMQASCVECLAYGAPAPAAGERAPAGGGGGAGAVGGGLDVGRSQGGGEPGQRANF